MSRPISRRCTGRMPGGMPVNVQFILDESKSPYEVRTIFRYSNGGTEWDIPLAMFAVLFKKHEVSMVDISLRLEVDEVRMTLTGEDDLTGEVILPLNEVRAFYDKAEKVT